MHLTQKQESLIAQFVRDAGRRLDSSLPDHARETRVRQLRTHIYRELEALRLPTVRDEDVIAVLRRSGSNGPSAPEPIVARPPSASRPRRKPTRDVQSKPVWLGVCAYNAERLGLETWILRTAAVVLGLVTGPLAVLAYLAGYTERYLGMDERERPSIDYGQVALRALGAAGVLILLRWGGGKIVQLIAHGHEQLLKEPVPPLGKWDWFQHFDGPLFLLAFISAVPLAILSGLPMANAWGHSLKRLAQAIVALYGTVLCFGLASILVGIILDRVEVYLQ